MSRIDDGPAEVTALAVAPRDDNTVVIGYADGQTRLWAPDQPTFEALPAGPRADGPVQRVQFDTTGRYLYLTCPAGLVVAARDGRTRTPVKIPGGPVAVFVEPNRDRFLAVRGNRAVLRYVPMELVRDPPAAKAVKGFVIPAPGPKGSDEVIPVGARVDYAVPAPLTFLAWHPAGKVLAGQPDGTIVTWPLPGPRAEPVTRVHKAPVRAWAAAGTGDFATGDDNGLVGVWPNKSLSPRTFGDGAAAVTQLAFDGRGARLAVADADGELSVWDAGARERLFRVRRAAPVKAMTFGPTDHFLLIGDGKGVEVWSVAALAKKQAGSRIHHRVTESTEPTNTESENNSILLLLGVWFSSVLSVTLW
jgi:WD40 repeat protein